MNDIAEQKRVAAEAALAELPERGVIGLGTGSTAAFFLEALARRIRDGAQYVGVPTSEASRVLAERLGIPLLDDAGPWTIDVTVDGADEVSDALDLIKGGGGAHTREKIVNASSRRNVIVADATKRSRLLGERRAIPLEVLRFGVGSTLHHLAALGAATIRTTPDGRPVPTDAGNLLVDLATGPMDHPASLDATLRAIPGVVETGLFLARADVVIVSPPLAVLRRR